MIAGKAHVVPLSEQPQDILVAFRSCFAASERRNEALIGLAGLRAGLFPEAAPYEPHEHEQRRTPNPCVHN